MNLIKTIEEFDPSHFSRRKFFLENIRKKVRDIGFFPLPLSQNDIECFWIRLEPNDAHKGKKIHLSEEAYFDMIGIPSLMKVYKEVAKYEKP